MAEPINSQITLDSPVFDPILYIGLCSGCASGMAAVLGNSLYGEIKSIASITNCFRAQSYLQQFRTIIHRKAGFGLRHCPGPLDDTFPLKMEKDEEHSTGWKAGKKVLRAHGKIKIRRKHFVAIWASDRYAPKCD